MKLPLFFAFSGGQVASGVMKGLDHFEGVVRFRENRPQEHRVVPPHPGFDTRAGGENHLHEEGLARLQVKRLPASLVLGLPFPLDVGRDPVRDLILAGRDVSRNARQRTA